MTDGERDIQRAAAAARALVDGRNLREHSSQILVTLEHLVAAVLLGVMDRDARHAASMLNEGLVPGVEGRLALHAAREQNKAGGGTP
jgi:hypothetical protein